MKPVRHRKLAEGFYEEDLNRLYRIKYYDLHYIASPNAPIGNNSFRSLEELTGPSCDILLKDLDGKSLLYKKLENLLPPLEDECFTSLLEKFTVFEGILAVWHPSDRKENGFNRRRKASHLYPLYRVPICELSNGERVIQGVWEETCALWENLDPQERYSLLMRRGHGSIAEVISYLILAGVIESHIDMEPNPL